MSAPDLYFVYILANRPRGAIYVGVTNELVRRVSEHRQLLVAGHTKKYVITQLVWFEAHDSIEAAIAREKRLKRWRRAWKNELIEEMNPTWRDLWFDLVDQDEAQA